MFAWVFRGVVRSSLSLPCVAMVVTRTLHIEPVALSTLTLDLMGVSNSWRLMIWMLGQRMPPSKT